MNRIEYSVGNEHNPGDPFGRSKLVIEIDGRARLDRYRPGGGREAWTGTVAASVLDRFWAALAESSFPEMPHHDVPAGSAIHSLTIGDGADRKSVGLAYHASLPGYDAAFSILETLIGQLKEDAAATPERLADAVARVSPDALFTPGMSFFLAYLPSRRASHCARLELLERLAASTDPALAHAIDFSRRALEIEASMVDKTDNRFWEIGSEAGVRVPLMTREVEVKQTYASVFAVPEKQTYVSVFAVPEKQTYVSVFAVAEEPPPPPPSRVAPWLASIAEAVTPHLRTPAREAAWRAGESAQLVAISVALAAHVAHLRCAAPGNPELRELAAHHARDLKRSAALLEVQLAATCVPHAIAHANRVARMVSVATDLEPATSDGYAKLNELARELGDALEATARELDA